METQPPVPPGRPRAFDRNQALERAMELFWRHGYESVSLTELTQALRIAPPSIYAAFGSKAGLYREALDLYQQRQEDLHKLLDAAGPVKPIIARFMKAAVRAMTNPGSPTGCMVSSGMFACAAAHHSEAEATAEHRKNFAESLRKRLQRARSEGDLAESAQPAVLARYLAAVLQGVSMQARDGASRRELDAIVDQALQAWP
jgi:AcrR family transcriptional regulator